MMTVFFVVDIALVLAFAYFVGTAVRPPTRPAFLVSFFVLVWVDLVLTAEFLSCFRLLTARGMAAGHFVLAGAAVLVWRAAGRPPHPRFFLSLPSGGLASLKSWPDLWSLGLAVGLAYALLACVNILVPPNNYDSLVYHLTRVAYWIQHRSLAPWPSPSLAQTAFPLNAEVGSLWSMIFLRRDFLVGFVQWSAALAAATAVFGMARGFGASRPQAGFASAVFLTLPMIVLQSTTTQNDLTVASMIAAMSFLFLLGLKTKHPGMLILSGAAFGLAMGMKITAPMIVPGFILAAAYVTLTHRPRPIRLLLTWAGACLASFAMLGALNYVQAAASLNFPLVKEKVLPNQFGQLHPGNITLIGSNAAYDLASFMDFSGIPGPAARPGLRIRRALGRMIFPALHVPYQDQTLGAGKHQYFFGQREAPANEARSFFGPLGFFLFLPLVLCWGVRGTLAKDARLIPALSFLGFMLILGASQAWMPFRGRFYCAAITLVAPLAAPLFGRGSRTVIRVMIGIMAITTLAVTVLTNVQKPLIGREAIWGKSRAELRTASAQLLWFPKQAIDKWIPAEATVATILAYDSPEYFVFGDRLSRTLVPIVPAPKVINLNWLRSNPYDYIVVRTHDVRRVADLPVDEFRVLSPSGYKIIIRKKAGS